VPLTEIESVILLEEKDIKLYLHIDSSLGSGISNFLTYITPCMECR
jgi:hypothetical protein